jgi:glycine C-acetyltransferase
MALNKVRKIFSEHLDELKKRGTLKGKETVIRGIKPARGKEGPRYYIEGKGDREFIRMNANSYLGMSLKKEVIKAEERAAQEFGAGPGAVRFISGTYAPHIELEKKLARFHRKESAMLFSSAYSAVMGILPPLISKETIVISDELNHNCIINAARLAHPKDKKIYRHNKVEELEKAIVESVGNCRRVIVVTDGIFSMRGEYAPLPEIANIQEKYDPKFEEGIISVVDDSHGVGAFGATGRGTMEYTGEERVDILVATLGKALGVNGGYLVSDAEVVEFLRETSPFYIYSNPITASEASAALKALEILDSPVGMKMLDHLRNITARFEHGLVDLGFEVIRGEHPVVPLMIRDTKKTSELVGYLEGKGVLATGLNYPVVPRGDEEIRFQVCADHTEFDIDHVLELLKTYRNQEEKEQGLTL